VEVVHKECVTAGSIREIFCPHSPQKCRFGTGAVQGMRRLDEDLEL
jgi:hypothetical protein